MENNRESWGSNLGFIMAAIGSAVGLGNIWGFPYKMGMSGGFTFLLVYIVLAIVVGLVSMSSELAIGRMTGKGVVGAYKQVTKKFKWLGWLGIISPFLIMSFYSVLGAYCFQYMFLNFAELGFGLSEIFGATITGSNTFGAMLTNQFGCSFFTLMFMVICMLIVKGGVSGGIEKFNKIGMPALFFMLLVVIIRSVTLPNAVEGLKFMFVPGYAVKGGFIEKAPDLISVIGTAGGQMFFSLSLAMGAMVTYGSYIGKNENLVKNSGVIIFSDTLVALMAGLAVIPAAVANGINSGVAVSDIKLSGPSLLFVTLQDVFSNMGTAGPLFGVIFYALVIIAAISSAISLMEVMTTYFLDKAAEKGKSADRTKITLWVSVVILIEALVVAIDGLGSNGVWVPGQKMFPISGWNDCWLDFMDFWSEGIAMPLGTILMGLMIGWERKPDFVLKEIGNGSNYSWFAPFYKICIKFAVPVVMTLVLAGQLQSFLGNVSPNLLYAISAVVLVVFWIFAAVGNKKEA